MSEPMMNDDKLQQLKTLRIPAPNEAARNRALDAAMVAFDREQVPQGSPAWTRLRSIATNLREGFAMNSRLSYGLGTAALALLILPLGYQLVTSTALTRIDTRIPIGVPPVENTSAELKQVPIADQSVTLTKPVPPTGPSEVLAQNNLAGTLAPSSPEVNTTVVTETPNGGLLAGKDGAVSADTQALPQQMTASNQPEPTALEPAPADEAGRADADQLKEDDSAVQVAAVSPEAPAAAEVVPLAKLAAPGDGRKVRAVAAQPATNAAQFGSFADAAAAPPPVVASMPMPQVVAQPTTPSGDQFAKFTESPVKVVATDPVSTFSIDVDTASYSYVRKMLGDGYIPEPDSVRLEELINYFPYSYPAATSASEPFKPTVSVYPTPWNTKTEIVQIGIKGYVPPATEAKPSNLVFLIDTSGSMDEPDKLPLLKRAFSLLVDKLTGNDTISIVTYAGSAGVVLPPTKASDKATILKALDNLEAGGSTAGAEGVELAYQLAEQNKIADGINRVILATDGDFNVGIDDPDDLKNFIKEKRQSGVFLSVLGFGEGNLGDDTMQALAQNGNGNASYIDSFKEAQKVLVQEMGGTLDTIAKDVKIQVEFNPNVVSEYRLIGYETRALNREDFNNDKVDAGDIGAGTTVTALYEITPKGSGAELNDPLRYGQQPAATEPAPAAASDDEIGFLKMRYKLSDSDTSKLISTPIEKDSAAMSIDQASEDSRWAAAVAAFGQKLKGSNYGDMSWDAIKALAQGARGSDEDGYRAEFMQMIGMAKTLSPADVVGNALQPDVPAVPASPTPQPPPIVN